jgi:beta-glucosidase
MTIFLLFLFYFLQRLPYAIIFLEANRSTRYGTYSTVEALNAGLDLEMPGPTRWRGPLLTHSLISKKISEKTLDLRVLEILKLVNRTRKSGVPQNALEGSRNIPETAELLRTISAESIVLLKNQNEMLPLQKGKSVSIS